MPLLLASLAAAAVAGPVSDQLSVTTYNEGKTALSGEVIFEDNFDELDMVAWQHELTLWGGGVSGTPPTSKGVSPATQNTYLLARKCASSLASLIRNSENSCRHTYVYGKISFPEH